MVKRPVGTAACAQDLDKGRSSDETLVQESASSRKLALSFGLVLLLTCGALAADTYASSRQAALTDRIVKHLDPARLNAANIITLVRAADDDGFWAQGALIHDSAHSRALFAAYYQEIGQLRAVLAEALRMADTPGQRAIIEHFQRYYFGFGPLSSADRRQLDAQTHYEVIDGTGGYTLGNEQSFVLARQHRWVAAFYGYTTIPFVGALQDTQTYIHVVQSEIDLATAQETSAANLVIVLSATLGILALLVGIGVVVLITRSIARPLTR